MKSIATPRHCIRKPSISFKSKVTVKHESVETKNIEIIAPVPRNPNIWVDPLGPCKYNGNCTCTVHGQFETMISVPQEKKKSGTNVKQEIKMKKLWSLRCKQRANQKAKNKKNNPSPQSVFPPFDKYIQELQSSQLVCYDCGNF